MTLRSSILSAVLFLAGCGASTLATAPASVCASGKQWTGGDEGSPLMHPGRDCIACHATKGDAPKFEVAGTVFTELNGADDCGGAEGATVEITDSSGKVFTLTTNAAGNFYLETRSGAVAKPYKAKVKLNGKERAMVASQDSGSCASCHTAKGANAAPGRIQLPQ